MKTSKAARTMASTVNSLEKLEKALDEARYVDGVTDDERDALRIALEAVMSAHQKVTRAAQPKLPDVSASALRAAAACENTAEIARLLAAGKRDASDAAVREVMRDFRAGQL